MKKLILIPLLIISAFVFGQSDVATWRFVRLDTVPGVVKTMKAASPYTESKVAAKAIYNVFERGKAGRWNDEEGGQIFTYEGFHYERQLLKITPTVSKKDLDLSKWFEFIPLYQLY